MAWIAKKKFIKKRINNKKKGVTQITKKVALNYNNYKKVNKKINFKKPEKRSAKEWSNNLIETKKKRQQINKKTSRRHRSLLIIDTHNSQKIEKPGFFHWFDFKLNKKKKNKCFVFALNWLKD